MKVINNQLDIKLEWFTQGELNVVQRKIKNGKAIGLDKITPEVWKTRKFDDLLLQYCNAVYNQNMIERWITGCIFPFLTKVNLELSRTTGV